MASETSPTSALDNDAPTVVSRPTASKGPLLAAALLVLIVVISYAPSLSSQFVRLDDYQYVVDNERVRLPTWTGVHRFFTEVMQPSTVDGYYQPLTMVSLMLDALLTGGDALDPFVYHLTNVLLHAATCVLLMFAVRRTVGGTVVPLLAAGLFALHPVHVESVAWISQRKTVLSALCAVASILCYFQYMGIRAPTRSASAPRASPECEAGRPRLKRWLGAAVMLYVLGGVAKPTVMLLPLTLPLLDHWLLRRRLVPALLDKLPFVACMLPMAWVAWASQASSSARLLAPNLAAIGTLPKTVALACYNFTLYLGNLFWPMSLSPYRDLPDDLAFGNPAILLSIALTIALIAVWFSARRWSRAWFAGAAAFAILLAPSLGAVRFAETCVADRFCYLPAVFLTFPLAALIVRIQALVPRRASYVQVCLALFALPLFTLSRAQQGVWQDSHALWGHVVQVAPNLAKGHVQFAAELLESGEFQSALEHARRAVERDRQNTGYQHVLGRALVRSGRAKEAVEVLRQALTSGLGPIEPLARLSLAEALIVTGDLKAAEIAATSAITMGRGAVSTYRMLGDTALQFAENYDLAADFYRRALAQKPDDTVLRWNLGTAMDAGGHGTEALAEYESVIETYKRLGRDAAILQDAVRALRSRIQAATSAPTER